MLLNNYIVGVLALLGAAALTWWCRAHPKQHNRFAHDALMVVMFFAGAWLFAPLGWIGPLAYVGWVVASSLWFVVRVCPHCAYHGRDKVPSSYCVAATWLAAKGDSELFAARFRRNLFVIAVGWFLPLIGGAVVLVLRYREAWALAPYLFLLAVFCLVAFFLVPAATCVGCEHCENKERCPRSKQAKSPVKSARTNERPAREPPASPAG
jgi:hypothetical protein